MRLLKPKITVVTFTGSPQPLINTGVLKEQFVTSCTVEAGTANANRCFIGESDVSSTKYTTSLAANDQAVVGGPEDNSFKQTLPGTVNLGKIYIRGTSGELAMVTVFVPDEG